MGQSECVAFAPTKPITAATETLPYSPRDKRRLAGGGWSSRAIEGPKSGHEMSERVGWFGRWRNSARKLVALVAPVVKNSCSCFERGECVRALFASFLQTPILVHCTCRVARVARVEANNGAGSAFRTALEPARAPAGPRDRNKK